MTALPITWQAQTVTSLPGCETLRSTCLYVCVSVCLSARMSQKSHFRTSRNFLYNVTRGRGSVGPLTTTIQYVMYFRFCGWRHVFPYNTPGASSQRRSQLFTVTHQVAPLNCSPGDEVCYRRLLCFRLWWSAICSAVSRTRTKGTTENAGASKMQGWKMREWK